MTELFVYGSLQLPVVLEIVLGYIPPMQIVQAPGWKVCQLKDAAYPGLVADLATIAVGVLLADLDDLSIAALDNFEGPQYRREQIEIHTAKDEVYKAYAYILADDSALPEVWTKKHLSGQALEKFLQHCTQWRAEYNSPIRTW